MNKTNWGAWGKILIQASWFGIGSFARIPARNHLLMGKNADCKVPLQGTERLGSFQWEGRDGHSEPPPFGAYLPAEKQESLLVAGESFSAPHRDSTREEHQAHFCEC